MIFSGLPVFQKLYLFLILFFFAFSVYLRLSNDQFGYFVNWIKTKIINTNFNTIYFMFFLVQEALSAPIELQSLTKCDPYRGRRLSFRNDYLRICSTCSWLRFYNIMAERADLLFENFVIWAHQLLNIKCQGYIVKKKNRSATPLSKSCQRNSGWAVSGVTHIAWRQNLE